MKEFLMQKLYCHFSVYFDFKEIYQNNYFVSSPARMNKIQLIKTL